MDRVPAKKTIPEIKICFHIAKITYVKFNEPFNNPVIMLVSKFGSHLTLKIKTLKIFNKTHKKNVEKRAIFLPNTSSIT